MSNSTNRKILYVTDDRSAYPAGSYYLAFQNAFAAYSEQTVIHPLTEVGAEIDFNLFDLIVIGHGTIDCCNDVLQDLSSLLGRIRFRKLVLKKLRDCRIPKIFFSKNDYKNFNKKLALIDFIRPDLVITHTKEAVGDLSASGVKTIWMPFGVDNRLFRETRKEKFFDIGFRSSRNTTWNQGLRERFYAELEKLTALYRTSLHISNVAENFLLGEEYADWLSSCNLLANTVSARGTVGPQFWESMACGCVPLAPENSYEDLLKADVHYVAVKEDLSNLREKIEQFLSDQTYRDNLKENCRKMVDKVNVYALAEKLLARIGKTGVTNSQSKESIFFPD